MARRRIKTSVSFAADTIEYLDKLAREADRPRSYVAEAIIRDHARQRRATVARPGAERPQELIRS